MSIIFDNKKNTVSFAKELYYNSITKAEEIAYYKHTDNPRFEEKKNQIKHNKFVYLTDKYFDTIIDNIFYQSNNGNRITYINFDKNDFKANCQGLGYPKKFMKDWFDELSDPNSKYLPDKYINYYFNYIDSDKKISLQGITINIWNNPSNTVVFEW